MGSRTSGRSTALQALFGLDSTGSLELELAPTLDVEAQLNRYWMCFEDDEAQAGETIDLEARHFGDDLVRGVVVKLADVDEAIRNASKNWRMERMRRVDRNILRLAAFELRHHNNTPRAVILDEAVELAKRYGTEESGSFVNGLLEKIADESGRDRTTGSSASSPGPSGSGPSGVDRNGRSRSQRPGRR